MMTQAERAKQFAPFDAMKGLQEALRDREERHARVERHEISEEAVIIYGGSMSQNNGIGMPGDMPNGDPGMNMWDRPGSTPAEMPEPPEGFPFGDENGPPDRFEMQVN